jgi:hypothetical protein
MRSKKGPHVAYLHLCNPPRSRAAGAVFMSPSLQRAYEVQHGCSESRSGVAWTRAVPAKALQPWLSERLPQRSNLCGFPDEAGFSHERIDSLYGEPGDPERFLVTP